mmetsp:Transcript_6962/g.15892  ORF Transcript_6962/g.15892 Transcript_6962/m.15892 type:complete len:86 (+) Transcript_6962:270-527(+)
MGNDFLRLPEFDLVRTGDMLVELGLQNNGRGKQRQLYNSRYNNDNQNICYKRLKIGVEGFELKALMLKAAGASNLLDVLGCIAVQ